MKFGSLLIHNSIFRGLNVIAGVLITFMLLRLIPVEGFGAYSLMVANAAIFNLVTCLGAESGIVYNYSSGKINKPGLLRILFTVTFFQLGLLLLIEFIVHFITGRYWIMGAGGREALLYGALYVTALAINDKYVSLFNAAHLYSLCNKIILLSNFLLLVLLAFFLLTKNSSNSFFYMQLIVGATFMQAILLVVFFHKFSGQSLSFFRPGKEDIKLFFSYSAVVFVTNCIQFLAYRADYWILDYYQGEESVGVYALAVRMSQLLWVFPGLFATIIFPKMAAGEENEEKVLSLMRITVAILFIVIILSFLFSSWVMLLVGGETYQGSIVPFCYLLPGVFLFSITIMLAAYFAGINKPYVNFTGSVICLIVVTGLDFILIPSYTIKGAAIASCIGYSAAAFFTIFYFCNYKKVSLYSLLIVNKQDIAQVKKYFTTTFFNK